MKRILLTAALLCGVSTVFAQVPSDSAIKLPPAPANQDPLKILKDIKSKASFDIYYKEMLKESQDFGAEPLYNCHNSDDGEKTCGNHINFNRDDISVSISDFVWPATGNHNQSICLHFKIKDPNQVCLRNDGETWAYDGIAITHIYRMKW